MTYEEHQAWEFGDRKREDFQWILKLEELLKQEYYGNAM